MDHPWRRLRDRPDWLLEWDMLPPGLMGSTCHRRRVITLDLRLSQAERRCTIAHELEHVERGPMPSDPILAAREEESIERAVARRLVTMGGGAGRRTVGGWRGSRASVRRSLSLRAIYVQFVACPSVSTGYY